MVAIADDATHQGRLKLEHEYGHSCSIIPLTQD
jgi:hypothetical protein